MHDYTAPIANSNQRDITRKVLKQCAKDQTCILAEDSYGYSGTNSIIKQFFDRIVPASSQSGLISFCQKLGLPAINLEYRFARMAILRPLFQLGKNIEDDTIILEESILIPNETLVEEFEHMVSTISQFDDGVDLNRYYHEHLQTVTEPSKALLQKIRAFPGTIAEYIHYNVPPQRRLKLIKLLYTWDTRLVDLKAIHEIAHCHKQRIFLFAGVGHIYLIGQALEKYLGYKKECVIGVEEQVEDPTSYSFNFSDPEWKPRQPMGTTHLNYGNPLPTEAFEVLIN